MYVCLLSFLLRRPFCSIFDVHLFSLDSICNLFSFSHGLFLYHNFLFYIGFLCDFNFFRFERHFDFLFRFYRLFSSTWCASLSSLNYELLCCFSGVLAIVASSVVLRFETFILSSMTGIVFSLEPVSPMPRLPSVTAS